MHAGIALMYRLILLSSSMPPGMDSLQTARQIKNLFREANLPVPYLCYCSANDGLSFKQVAMKEGLNYFLVKPIVEDELVSMLQYFKMELAARQLQQ